jgi:spoIIIJ-associated protein
MEVYIYEGKDEELVLEKALTNLNVSENDIMIKKEKVKGGLFKSDNFKFTIIKLEDIIENIKEFLKELLTLMDLDINFETSLRDKQINIKMFSNNNAILIGKNGQTLTALTTIVKQYIYNQVGVFPYINLDVENYKDKQIMYLERLAKNIAREVKATKQSVVMENMNPYERRIVHTVLADFDGIITESEGMEPNRHIVVKSVNE